MDVFFLLAAGRGHGFLCSLAHEPETPWGGRLAQLLMVRARPQGRLALLTPLPAQWPCEAQVRRS